MTQRRRTRSSASPSAVSGEPAHPPTRGTRTVPATSRTDPSAPFLSLPQVARILGVHRSTVYRLADAGAFATFRVGRQIRVRREDLEMYLAQHRTPPADEQALIARGKIVALPRAVPTEDEEERGHRLADDLGLM